MARVEHLISDVEKAVQGILIWSAADFTRPESDHLGMYRDRLKGMQILLSMTQAGPGITGKQEQEQTSPNHVQTL